MIRKDLVVAILLTFCLTSILFFIIPSRSNPDDANYNPWADVNCDGQVDLFDAILLANSFNLKGTPIDKSAYQLLGTMSKPAYDSNWTYIEPDQEVVFDHGLNTTNVFVYMVGKTNQSASPYIHQIDYGGESNYGYHWGVNWYDLTNMSIRVHRQISDTNWDQVRIYIWKIPEP
jgi:hypothetical protein